MSWPGSAEIKNGLLNCTQCHSLQPVVRSHVHRGAVGAACSTRMGRYSQGSTPTRPQLRPGNTSGGAILAAEHGRARRRRRRSARSS